MDMCWLHHSSTYDMADIADPVDNFEIKVHMFRWQPLVSNLFNYKAVLQNKLQWRKNSLTTLTSLALSGKRLPYLITKFDFFFGSGSGCPATAVRFFGTNRAMLRIKQNLPARSRKRGEAPIPRVEKRLPGFVSALDHQATAPAPSQSLILRGQSICWWSKPWSKPPCCQVVLVHGTVWLPITIMKPQLQLLAFPCYTSRSPIIGQCP